MVCVCVCVSMQYAYASPRGKFIQKYNVTRDVECTAILIARSEKSRVI